MWKWIPRKAQIGLGFGFTLLMVIASLVHAGISAASGAAELADDRSAVTGEVYADPQFSYAPASRDWREESPAYFLENDKVKIIIGTDHLATGHPTDWGDAASGNNRPGTLAPGHIMDAVPLSTKRENLDYTEFVLSEQVGRTWWYPNRLLDMPLIERSDYSITAQGEWEGNRNIKARVTYSLVEHSPLVKMKVTLTNEGSSMYTGHLAYIIDPEETLEQQSYVPGWGWRGGEVGTYITSGWNQNYIFNGSQDKFSGHTAHAIIWPEEQQPSALIPEGYVTGAWFPVSMAPGESDEVILYHLPHVPSSAYEPYLTAELWANVVATGSDPGMIGMITGEVRDASGEPSPGVKVELYAPTGEKAASATTNANGAYEMYAPRGQVYRLSASNGTEVVDITSDALVTGKQAYHSFVMDAPRMEVISGVTKGDPGFTYEGTSRDWWPAYEYYYLESPEIKFTVGTVRTAGMDPVDWSNDASGNNKWGSLTRGHIMDAVPKLTMQENLDYTEFVLSDDLGVTPEDEANGKHMEWSWFHPLHKLEMPDIERRAASIAASGDWDFDENMKAWVEYSIVEGTPLIQMDIKLENRTGQDFDGHFGYIIDPDQPGEQHSYLPGRNWVYNQEKNGIRSGWTENYLFNGINHSFTGKTAHAIIWPEDQQPEIIMHEGIFVGSWFKANIPNGATQEFTVYHLPHVPGPADRPYAVAEFFAKFIREGADPADYGSITGKVVDEEGRPVPKARIISVNDSGETAMEAMTNSKGDFQIFVENGTYQVTVQHDEYALEQSTVEVSAEEKRQRLDVVLKRFAEVAVDFPSELNVGEPFDITVTVENVSDQPLYGAVIHLLPPPSMVYLIDPGAAELATIETGDAVQMQWKAIALEGGRSEIEATVQHEWFSMRDSKALNATGAGYYGGDSHSHTQHSDGVHSVAQNSENMYEKRLLSWIFSTDHNKDQQKADAEAVTEHYGGRFLSLSGTEITTPLGHALALGFDGVPRADIQEDGPFGWQESIHEVVGQGGLFYIAHPFEQTYAFQDPYQWRGFTGVEVWNGTWHPLDAGVNEQAFRFWDEINIRGDGKYYGLAASDAHTRDKTGDPYSKGWIPELTEEHVLDMLRNGRFYGSNGPEIRFTIDGVGMGDTLQIEGSHNAVFRMEAYDPHSNLTHVRLLKYRVTGETADYEQREIVWEEDLAGQRVNTYSKTLVLPVADQEFYRLEVRSERAQPNNSGIGPLTGTGFAYSNPVWVEVSETSNAAGIETIEYHSPVRHIYMDRFGMDLLAVNAASIDLEKLHIKTSEGAVVEAVEVKEIVSGRESVSILDIAVKAKDGSVITHSYLLKLLPRL